MKFTTTAVVAAPPEKVFAALNDPELLRRSIPGCEEMTAVDADTFKVKLKLGLAGVKGQYSGTVLRRDLRPPESFTLVFDGKGLAGFVRGTAAIHIVGDEHASTVNCEADVQVGGAIAAIGSRLVGAAAQKTAQDFFQRLAGTIGAPPETLAGQ